MGEIFDRKKYQTQSVDDYNAIDAFYRFVAQKLNEIEGNIQNHRLAKKHFTKILNNRKSNIEVQLRFKQGFVEIPDNQAVPALDDAILITRQRVNGLNQAIKVNGNMKIEAMNRISLKKYQKQKEVFKRRKYKK